MRFYKTILSILYVCMYICMYVFMYVCMNVCACMYVVIYVCVCVYLCMYVCMYVCMYLCMYYVCMYVCACMYLCMYVLCMYVCMCVHVCMYVRVCIYVCMCVFLYVCMCTHRYMCVYLYTYIYTNLLRYSNPFTGLDRPWGFHYLNAPRFQDSRPMKVVRLSALSTVRLYPPDNIPITHFCQWLSRPQGHSAAERIMSMKKIQRNLRESNPRPYALLRSVSTNCATA